MIKRFKRASGVLAILSLAFILAWPIGGLVSQFSIKRTVPRPAAPHPAAPEGTGLPVRLKIPRIAVDAVIEKVGLANDGSMDIPSVPMNAGWYELGPRPGETGSAVIDGHINWYHGATGVFANLSKLKPGDKITVLNDKNEMISFVVRESRSFDSGADAYDVFFSSDGKAHLNFITCEGAWNKKTKQYSQRLVVFADKEIQK